MQLNSNKTTMENDTMIQEIAFTILSSTYKCNFLGADNKQ